MSFQKQQVIFHDTAPLYFFGSNIRYFLQKQLIKVQVFRLSTTRVKTRQVPHVIFHTKIQFFFKILINLECYDITPLYFLGSNLIYFRQKQHMKVQIFRLATARIKLHQIHYVIFGTQSQLFFKFCITLHCHET